MEKVPVSISWLSAGEYRQTDILGPRFPHPLVPTWVLSHEVPFVVLHTLGTQWLSSATVGAIAVWELHPGAEDKGSKEGERKAGSVLGKKAQLGGDKPYGFSF